MIKIQNILYMSLFILFLAGCQEREKPTKRQIDPNINREAPVQGQQNIQTPPAQQPSAATGGGKVSHYICPNGCQGGESNAAGSCPVCGTEMSHNQAFHTQSMDPSTAIQNPAVTPQQTPEPPQNSFGVWHYTCPNGCDGGAGTATACSNCGTTLTHNPGYH